MEPEEIKNELSEKDVEEINDVIEETAVASPEISSLRQITESENPVSDGEDVNVLVTKDPITGRITHVDPFDELQKETSKTFDDILNDDSIPVTDPTSIPLNVESVQKSLQEVFPNFDINDTFEFIKACDRYRNKEKFGYYNAMPQGIKDEINKAIGAEMSAEAGKLLKGAKNQIAEDLMRTVIDDNYFNQASMDLDASIKKELESVYDSVKKPLSEYNLEIKRHFEEYYPNIADKIEAEDPEKANRLRKVSQAYIQANTLESFKEAAKTIKVKQIQLDKFDRTCNSFNSKYTNTNEVIRDIKLTPPILLRHLREYGYLTEDVSDTEAAVLIGKFIVAFINFTKNMSPSVIEEHVYMYYVINNICQLDFINTENEESKAIATKFLDAVWEIICHYRDLNKEKKANE